MTTVAFDVPVTPMTMATAADEQHQQLKKGIAEFYDESSGMWGNIWGEHMHHGFYDNNVVVELSDHRAAQIRMIEQSLLFASVAGTILLLPSFYFDSIHFLVDISRNLKFQIILHVHCHCSPLVPLFFCNPSTLRTNGETLV
ncbi:hypothetical protein L1887_14755 [Cichorium endivia]|nr:hypothetical protein L1887_14755 [Cichorium endivia]